MTLRKVGWAVAAACVGLGLAAPWIVRSVSPRAAVDAAVLRAFFFDPQPDHYVRVGSDGAGWLSSHRDPWGREYCRRVWRPKMDRVHTHIIDRTHSCGPDGRDDRGGGDDLPIRTFGVPRCTQILAWSPEMLIGLGIAIAWAMAGPWSRTSRGPSLAREVLLAALMAAPFAALFCAAWLLVTRGEDALAVAQLQVVPASVAVCGSVCVAAFLAALAWRLLRGHGVSEEKTEETGEERAEAQAY